MWKRSVSIEPSPWAFAERPRILVEHANDDDALRLATAIRGAGWTVGICRGPDAHADPETRCPLHRLEPCVAVEGADLVVTALDLEEETGREVLRGLRTRYAKTPLVVLAAAGEKHELGDLVEGCTVLPVEVEPARLIAAIRDELESGVATAERV